MHDIIQLLYSVRNGLEQIELKGSLNMLTMCSAVANLNKVIEELTKEESDVQS